MLGVLDFESNQQDSFADEETPVLQSLADQLAIAIQNASLYQVEQTQRRLAETLYRVGRAVTHTLELTEVLDLILAQLAEIIPFDRASILVRDNANTLETLAARGFPAAAHILQTRIPLSKGDVFDEVYDTQQPLMIPDVLARPDWQSIESLPQARAWLGVPLIHFGRVATIMQRRACAGPRGLVEP
jgi:GAF domain-containing protein